MVIFINLYNIRDIFKFGIEITSILSSPSLVADHPCAIPLNLAAAEDPAGGGSGCMFVTSGTSKFIRSTKIYRVRIRIPLLNRTKSIILLDIVPHLFV